MIRQRMYYTITCDGTGCNTILEDYTGELAGITLTKYSVEQLAKEEGFKQISQRKWLCPECYKKYKKNNK